jgi:hypothetical protein
MKATQKLHDLGQSLWLDNITRDLLRNPWWGNTPYHLPVIRRMINQAVIVKVAT